MKTKFTMFRRGEMFYMQDSANGKQTSLHTKDESPRRWRRRRAIDPQPRLKRKRAEIQKLNRRFATCGAVWEARLQIGNRLKNQFRTSGSSKNFFC